MKKTVYLDFDDFHEGQNRLDWLWMLKEEFPNFLVNLFTVPDKCSTDFLAYADSLKWVQLCIHGYKHDHNEEISKAILKKPGTIFAKVYRAPFWQLSDEMYKKLKELDYKIMLHPSDPRKGTKYNWDIKDSPPFLDTLYGHGHIGDYPPGEKGNGIVQAFGNILKLPKDTEFKFL